MFLAMAMSAPQSWFGQIFVRLIDLQGKIDRLRASRNGLHDLFDFVALEWPFKSAEPKPCKCLACRRWAKPLVHRLQFGLGVPDRVA